MKRPDRTELSAILTSAREQVAAGATGLLTTKTFRRDLVALDWNTPGEICEGLHSVLQEVDPRHYCGERPPVRANDRACPGAELIPFSWKSEFLGQEMYFKVGVHSNGSLCLVSLHRSTAQ